MVKDFQRNSSSQNATRSGPQSVKIGIGYFRAYIVCPTTSKEQPIKHLPAGSSKLLSNELSQQTFYGHTVVKDILVNLSRGMLRIGGGGARGVCAWLGVRYPPFQCAPPFLFNLWGFFLIKASVCFVAEQLKEKSTEYIPLPFYRRPIKARLLVSSC